jgi:predicted component of type VI protein secretion system
VSWRLLLIKGAELADKPVPEVLLPEPLRRFIIGRDPACAWVLSDRTLAISARHCEIVAGAGGPVLRDLSTNGTFVNDAPTRLEGEHALRDGDHIELGPFTLKVSGPPLPASAATPAPAAAPLPPRSPGVMDTAPVRGGDPAAMLAAGGGFEKVGLTEILRAAPPAEASSVDVTKIRSAPAARAEPAPAAPSPLHEALARGLGVPAASIVRWDATDLASQLAATARLACAALPTPTALAEAVQRGEDPTALVRQPATKPPA